MDYYIIYLILKLYVSDSVHNFTYIARILLELCGNTKKFLDKLKCLIAEQFLAITYIKNKLLFNKLINGVDEGEIIPLPLFSFMNRSSVSCILFIHM